LEIRKLNTLRGIAAFIVLLTHFSDQTGWLGGSLGGGAGQYGVMLFFLLSGFLMAYLYLGREFNKQAVTHYALARAGRVIPLFLAVIFLSYLSRQLGYEFFYNIGNAKELTSHLLFAHGESVLWTIAPEIHFYLLFLILWYLQAIKPGSIYLPVVVGLILIFLTNFPRPNGHIAGFTYDLHTFRSLPYFLIGLILGMHYQPGKIPNYLKSSWFVASLALIPMLYPEFSPINDRDKHRMWLSYEVLFVVSTSFFAVVFLVPDNNILLSNKVGDFFGKISYSLYLLHMPVLLQVNKLAISTELKLLLYIAGSVLIALLSYQYFERPMARLIRNLRVKPV